MATQTFALFTSEERLKMFSPVDLNVQPEKIRPFIQTAQDMQLQAMMGSNFYQVLLAQVVAYGNTGNTDPSVFSPFYQTFIEEFVEPLVIWSTIYDYLPWAQYKIYNTGLTKTGVEPHSGNRDADAKALDMLLSTVDAKRQNYKERLRLEIIINIWKYPDLVVFSANQNMQPTFQPNYNHGIFLPKSPSAVVNQKYGAEGMNAATSEYELALLADFYSPWRLG
jgi:hypothetical protein